LKYPFYLMMILAAFLKCWIGKMQKLLLIIGLLIVFGFTAIAQKPQTAGKKSKADSTQAKHDSLKSKQFIPKITDSKIYHPDSTHDPNKAMRRSLMVPGWGQIYNHKWWKVPVIYTGLALLVDAYLFNEKYYAQDLAIAKYRERGTSPSPGDKYYDLYQEYAINNYPDQSIDDAVRAYARYRDLSVFGFVAAWGIQTIDAYIDAKFMHSYTMDNNFTLKVGPDLINQPTYAQNFNGLFIPGLKLTFALK
jgi:hypothetical protein